jgi:hypothetical protein
VVEAWRIQHFGDSSPAGLAADLADPDADGESNLYEFATGQNPSAGTTRAPTLAGSSGLLELTYTRAQSALAAGYGFTVEWSDTLDPGSWSTTGVITTVLADNGILQTVRAGVSFADAPRRFLRLRVTKP